MKLHGRITFFGEYLLKDNLSYCLCIKSKLFLTNEKRFEYIGNHTYTQSKDEIILLLRKHGVKIYKPIFGNLPLGYGLSSSTILSMLHLNSSHNKDLILNIDEEICGFSPSELDYISITKQENGIFGFSNWHALSEFQPIYSLIMVPKESKKNLSEVIPKLSPSIGKQILLTKAMYLELLTKNELNYELLLEYCGILNSCEVYSDKATEIISSLLKINIASKCIGGLYDKAILVIHKSNSSKARCDEFVSKKFDFARVLE